MIKVKYYKVLIAMVLLIITFSACTPQQEEVVTIDGSWKDIPLTDVNTGEIFKISDFEGTPVLIESFAVWCSICKLQQDQIKELHNEIGDEFISIGLNTDPNEDAEAVKGHTSQYGYDWHFVISPIEFTNALIDQFGITVVNAPSAPVIMICEDQNTKFLENGVKSAEDLKQSINQGC